MRRFRPTVGLVLAALAVLVLPAGAGAATTVGSNLVGTPNALPSANTSFAPRTQPPGVTLPLTAPSDGVIVQMLVKHGGSGADPGSNGFRVLTGSPATYTTTGVPTELPDFAWPANDIPGTRLFIPSAGGVPKGIPIVAGQRLGMVRIGGTGMQGALIWSNSSGGNLDTGVGVHNSGSFPYGTTAPDEILMQYLIEPDADRDGFGDETQDRCPSIATTQTACPTAPAATPAKKKKCKKRKRRSADVTKKKRCKKKRKKKR